MRSIKLVIIIINIIISVFTILIVLTRFSATTLLISERSLLLCQYFQHLLVVHVLSQSLIADFSTVLKGNIGARIWLACDQSVGGVWTWYGQGAPGPTRKVVEMYTILQ